MTLNRRTFIGGALASAALPGLGETGGRIARVGLMTDTHVEKTLASCAKVRAALELFKAQGAELVVNCGDIANQHCPEGYRLYRQTVNEVYPDPATRPQELFVYAAHDVNNYKPGSNWDMGWAADAFRDVRRFLEAPNEHTSELTFKGLKFLTFPQTVGRKGFPSWTDYEAAIARACAANPGKPVFVLEHVPPAGTTFHSRQWGSDRSRRILDKYPQVVSVSGHVHGSLVCERQIWQGAFTAVNVGCLSAWGGFAPGSTPPPETKKSFGVLVMDVYADRLVFFRYDIRDRSECAAPWIVPLPFVAETAPYRPEVAATRHARAAFAAGAAVTVTPDGEGYRVDFPEAREGADAFMYRLACERRTAQGWTAFSRDDIFGDFWKAAKDRTGRMSYRLDRAFFTAGETYRLTVTPLDWFYRPTAPIAVIFTATVGQDAAVWTCAEPMKTLGFTEFGRPVPVTSAGVFAPPSGQGTLRLPEHVFKQFRPGTTHRLVVDLDAVQPDGDWCAWRARLQTRGGKVLAEVQTSPGRPGVLRYVFRFAVPKDGLDTCDVMFNYVSPGATLRVVGILLV